MITKFNHKVVTGLPLHFKGELQKSRLCFIMSSILVANYQ